MAHHLPTALAVAGVVITGEYFFRHYVLFWLPTVGVPIVNDMLSLLLAYGLLSGGLGLVMHIHWGEVLRDVWQAWRIGVRSWEFTVWLLILVLSLVVLSVLDGWLWGDVALPVVVSPYRNSAVWWAGLATPLKVFALIAINGLFVPVAEEFLWRGLVQPRLAQVWPASVAIGLTAVLFSFKHALVDASLGRLLTLVAFGAICGIMAHRSGWQRSAALHLSINTLSTAAGLAFGLQ